MTTTLRSLLLVLLLALCTSVPAPAGSDRGFVRAGDFPTADEAIALAFPDCAVAKSTIYLDDVQRAEVERRLGDALESAIARPYVARRADGSIAGVAWLDNHVVRTKRQTLMVAVDAAGAVQRIEVLAFDEPASYLPRAAFFGQFVGETLDDDLALDRDVRNVAGATMSARATIGAARRSLALHGVLFPPAPEPEPAPESTPR